MSRPLSQRYYDWFFIIYFIMHIPITLLCDAQAFVPSDYFPRFFIHSLQSYIRDFDDRLMAAPPLWFKAIILAELIFQLPYFFFAAYAFIRGRNWIRTTTIIYCTQVLGTMVCILPEAWDRSNAPINTKLGLMSIYGIWAVIPLMLMQRVWKENVFGSSSSEKSGKKQQ